MRSPREDGVARPAPRTQCLDCGRVAGMDETAAALVKSLNAQRDHVVGVLDGLTEEELSRPVLPTGWTCAGLVHHLAVDVERFWFRAVVAGAPGAAGGTVGSAWQVPP